MSGHPIGGGLIQNPISGAITPDYTPAQKIEAVRNTVPGALHLGKREAEAEAYYGGYGGYGLATIGLHGRNPSAYTGPAYGAVVIGKVYIFCSTSSVSPELLTVFAIWFLTTLLIFYLRG